MENRVSRKVAPHRSVLAAKVIEAKCPICGSDSVVNDPEKLCWVCRRLKVSAWRDSDHSIPIQE